MGTGKKRDVTGGDIFNIFFGKLFYGVSTGICHHNLFPNAVLPQLKDVYMY